MSLTIFSKQPWREYKYDYYNVDVPSDCETDWHERAQIAFRMAEERTKIFALPCMWYVISDNGETVRVCRKRYNRSTRSI